MWPRLVTLALQSYWRAQWRPRHRLEPHIICPLRFGGTGEGRAWLQLVWVLAFGLQGAQCGWNVALPGVLFSTWEAAHEHGRKSGRPTVDKAWRTSEQCVLLTYKNLCRYACVVWGQVGWVWAGAPVVHEVCCMPALAWGGWLAQQVGLGQEMVRPGGQGGRILLSKTGARSKHKFCTHLCQRCAWTRATSWHPAPCASACFSLLLLLWWLRCTAPPCWAGRTASNRTPGPWAACFTRWPRWWFLLRRAPWMSCGTRSCAEREWGTCACSHWFDTSMPVESDACVCMCVKCMSPLPLCTLCVHACAWALHCWVAASESA